MNVAGVGRFRQTTGPLAFEKSKWKIYAFLICLLIVCLEISNNMEGGFERFVHPKGSGLQAERHQAAGFAVTGHQCHQLSHFAVTQRPKKKKKGTGDP